jgi:hypothetical protein
MGVHLKPFDVKPELTASNLKAFNGEQAASPLSSPSQQKQ